MTISYTTGIPAANHNPSTDQPNMRTNNDNIKAIIAVDHSTFDAANSGTHNHVTFTSSQIDPALSAGQNQIYPKTLGTATTYLETYEAFRASSGAQVIGYSPLVKCMGRFTTIVPPGPYPATIYNSAAQTVTEQNTIFVNISTIVQSNDGVDAGFKVTINFANALPNANYYIFFDDSSTILGFDPLKITKSTTSIVLINGGFILPGTVGIMVI